MGTNLLTTDDLVTLLSCSRATLYRFMSSENFPLPLKVGAGNRWPEAEVEKWLQERPRAQLQGVVEDRDPTEG